jgi:hypothetical protein
MLANTEGQGIKHTVKFSESLGAVGATVMQVGTLITSLKSAFEIWSDEDATLGEKVLTTMTTMGTVIPILTSVLNKNNLTKLAGFSASVKHALGMKVETAAAKSAADATTFFGTALWSTIWPIGLVIGLITALIAIIKLLIDAWKNWNPSEKLKIA